MNFLRSALLAGLAMLPVLLAAHPEWKQAYCVGVIDDDYRFDLTIKFVTSFETQFGTTFVNICEDADANVVVYKGSNLLGGKGEKVQVKATIKAHDYRDGVAQTIISRPKAK